MPASSPRSTPTTPPISTAYLADNYLAIQKALGLDADDIVTLARNSILASLVPDGRRHELLAEIDAFLVDR